MKIGHVSSTESSKDIKTGKKTGTYIQFESSGLSLYVPTNDDDYNSLAKKADLIKPHLRAIKKVLVKP